MPPRITYSTGIVLFAVSRGFRYGFEIMDASGLPSGTVYPILRRLEDAGLLNAKWEAIADARDEQRPARRYYQITGVGRTALRDASAKVPGLTGTLQPDASPARS